MSPRAPSSYFPSLSSALRDVRAQAMVAAFMAVHGCTPVAGPLGEVSRPGSTPSTTRREPRAPSPPPSAGDPGRRTGDLSLGSPEFARPEAITDPSYLAAFQLLAQFCQVGLRGRNAAWGTPQAFGCLCCPPFSDCGPGRAVVENPDVLAALVSGVEGSFTARGRAEYLASFGSGCGMSAEGGSMAILERRKGASLVSAQEDFWELPVNCDAYRRKDGVDLAVCETHTARQSFGRTTVTVGDFTKAESTRWQPIATLEDNSLVGCWSEPGYRVVRAQLVAKRYQNSTADGRPALLLDVSVNHSVVDAPYRAACEPILASSAAPFEPPMRAPPRRYELVFRFDGARFVPTAESRRHLDDLVYHPD